MGTIANILGFGQTNGPHYKLDYSTATGAGITTMTQATLATTNGVSNILSVSDDGYSVVLRSDPIATNGFPRSEWREMATNGTTERAFNPTSGDHAIEVMVLPMHLPPIRPRFVVCQIHDDANGNNQDILEIVLSDRSDYATSGMIDVVLRVAHDGQGGSSVGIPKLVTSFQWGTWLHCKIRVGAIAPGGATGWQGSCNGTIVQSWDAGMPEADFVNGNNAYWKTGVYLQTKWTGAAGGNGVETDRNEYGEAAWRYIRTYHNGEASPYSPAIGTPTYDAVSNVRAGTKANGHRTVSSPASPINITPGLPASLTNKTMLLCVVRSSRGTNTTTAGTAAVPKPNNAPSSPTMTAAQGEWTKLISMRMPVSSAEPQVGAYTGGPALQAHTVRWQLWAKKWESGDAAPTVSVPDGTTLNDTLTAQIIGFDDARMSEVLAELVDKLPVGLDPANPNDNNAGEAGITFGAATSTTQLGPTGTLTDVMPGSLALAYVAHETNTTNTTVAVVAGTDSPALTWAELGQLSVVTITPAAGVGASAEDEPAWALDYAIVPGSVTGQDIVAKTAAATVAADANKPAAAIIAGKGWGVLFTVQPAQQRRRGHRAACTVG